jgi:tRNA pseudouridine55 synthase
VACSKGTYIRTLAEDIGAVLGCGAHLHGLRRTATGSFQIADAVSLGRLEGMTETERDEALAPPEAIVGQFPAVRLASFTERRFCQGQSVEAPVPDEHLPGTICRVYGEGGRFLGLAQWEATRKLTPRRLMAELGDARPTS